MNIEKKKIELTPAKSYKKRLFISCDKDTKRYHLYHSFKLANMFSQYHILFKTNASLYSNASQYSGATKD